MLNEQGERYKGKPFKGRTFDKWMLNEKYTGEFTFGGRHCDNMYPAIVDKNLFERVQKRLTANKYTAGGQATAKEPYLLTGKLYCGHCGTEMISGGGTSETGIQHHYYVCKKKRSGKCDKHSENKNNLELYVTNCVRDFLNDKKNAETAVDDVLAYYDKRTDEQNLKSVITRINKINEEVSALTDSFVKAKSILLQNSIEKKMAEYEVLLNDLETQKAQLELERGYRLTREDLLAFIEEILKSDVNDKNYQKQIIDHLVSQVFVSDDDTIVYFNIRGGKDIEKMTFDDVKNTKNNIKGVQTQSPLASQTKRTGFCLFFLFYLRSG